MPEEAHKTQGLIGPNAVLQFLPVLDHFGGAHRRAELLVRAGILRLPDGKNMIPETDAARLHRQLRREEPELAPDLAAKAGIATGDYILKHRIPPLAQAILRALPSSLSARMLSRAIARHAWTFVGSGALHVVSPWVYEIENNPLISGECSAQCLCTWHEGVFSRLYQSLVATGVQCTETCCGAQGKGKRCRFELVRGQV